MAEPDSERREKARSRVPKAVVFDDYHELLTVPGIDAVVISLPNALHAEAAVAALEQGKHVYLEKPLATNLEAGRRVLEVWQSSRLVGMIGFNYRFHALYQRARQYIQSGELSPLVGVRSIFSTPPRPVPDSRQSPNSGGVLLNLASHHIDLIHFFFEEKIHKVWASLGSESGEEDNASLQLDLANGLEIQSLFSTTTIDEDRFEVYSRERKLTIDRYLSWDVEITGPISRFARSRKMVKELRSMLRSPNLFQKLFAPHHEPSYRAALSHFVAATLAQQSARPDFYDGYRSLAVIEAARESAREERVVLVPDVDQDLRRKSALRKRET